MSIISKLKKNSTIDISSPLDKSSLFDEKDIVKTSVPIFNIALGGSVDGGLTPGITMFAGPSKHFKTAFALLAASTYMEQYPDSAMIFYDTEFGAPESYFDSFGIDRSRVLHTPIMDIEEFMHDIMVQLQNIERGQRVVIVFDSIGNIASKKETNDALDGKDVSDMTRAKRLKALFRLITIRLNLKNIPMLIVNHTYKTQEMYSKDVVSGGTGGVYNSDNIYIIGRQQEKEGDELKGYNFVMNVEKSRYVREKSKFIVEVTFDGGIKKWSGLMDIALDTGHLIKPKQGWYALASDPEKLLRKKQLNKAEVWNRILADPTFDAAVKAKYLLSEGSLLADMNETDDDLEETSDDE